MKFWVIISLLAMAANAGKVFTIRRLCGSIDSRLLVLCSRSISAIVLIPILLLASRSVPRSGLFWGTVAITAVLTAIASILLTEAIKKGQIASVMPAQATVPLFMLLFLIIGFGEHPAPNSIFWTLATAACLAATIYLSSAPSASSATSPAVIFTFFSLISAVIFGICTVLDRVAITAVAGGALAYSACWNLASAGILAAECWRNNTHWRLPREKFLPILTFSLLSLIAFFSQQFAVQLSAKLPGGVVNVKTIVMLHLPLVIGANYLIFAEKCSKKLLFFGLLTIACGIALIHSV